MVNNFNTQFMYLNMYTILKITGFSYWYHYQMWWLSKFAFKKSISYIAVNWQRTRWVYVMVYSIVMGQFTRYLYQYRWSVWIRNIKFSTWYYLEILMIWGIIVPKAKWTLQWVWHTFFNTVHNIMNLGMSITITFYLLCFLSVV